MRSLVLAVRSECLLDLFESTEMSIASPDCLPALYRACLHNGSVYPGLRPERNRNFHTTEQKLWSLGYENSVGQPDIQCGCKARWQWAVGNASMSVQGLREPAEPQQSLQSCAGFGEFPINVSLEMAGTFPTIDAESVVSDEGSVDGADVCILSPVPHRIQSSNNCSTEVLP